MNPDIEEEFLELKTGLKFNKLMKVAETTKARHPAYPHAQPFGFLRVIFTACKANTLGNSMAIGCTSVKPQPWAACFLRHVPPIRTRYVKKSTAHNLLFPPLPGNK